MWDERVIYTKVAPWAHPYRVDITRSMLVGGIQKYKDEFRLVPEAVPRAFRHCLEHSEGTPLCAT